MHKQIHKPHIMENISCLISIEDTPRIPWQLPLSICRQLRHLIANRIRPLLDNLFMCLEDSPFSSKFLLFIHSTSTYSFCCSVNYIQSLIDIIISKFTYRLSDFNTGFCILKETVSLNCPFNRSSSSNRF